MKTNEEHIVKVAKALSDRTRVIILKEIAKHKNITCNKAVEFAGLSQPTVSHHLKVLRDAGLLNIEKDGRHHIITVNIKALNLFNELISDSIKIK